jgi:hypothetical protein
MRVTASHLNAKALTRAGSDGIVAAASASARSTSAKIGNAELLRVIAPRRARYVVRFLSPRFLSHRVAVAECLSFSLEKTRSKRKHAYGTATFFIAAARLASVSPRFYLFST